MATLIGYTEYNFEAVRNFTKFAGATFYLTNSGVPIDITNEKLVLTIRTRAKSSEIIYQLTTEGTSPLMTITDGAGGIAEINANEWLMEFPEAGVYVWDLKLIVSEKIYCGGTFTVLEPITKITTI